MRPLLTTVRVAAGTCSIQTSLLIRRFMSVHRSQKDRLGILELDNPKAFHALTLPMIETIRHALDDWKYTKSTTMSDHTIDALWVSSRPIPNKHVFCAGGNVKDIYWEGRKQQEPTAGNVITTGEPGQLPFDFFDQEYQINYLLACAGLSESYNNNNNNNNNTHVLPLQISIWNGLVLGGGVGLTMHGRFRIATEHTVLAMPETAIGFFPDVGSSYWIPNLLLNDNDDTDKCPNGMALYMALTGARLLPYDLTVTTSLATHYVPSDQLDDLQQAVQEALSSSTSGTTVHETLCRVLDSFHQNDPPSTSALLTPSRLAVIDQAFGGIVESSDGTVYDIVTRLQDLLKDPNNNDAEIDLSFAQDTLKTLQHMSPTSMAVTLEALRRGRALIQQQHSSPQVLEHAFAMEFRMSQAFVQNPESDFYPGIESVLVDKSRDRPDWNPPDISQVTSDQVASYFEALPMEWQAPPVRMENASTSINRRGKL